MKFYNVSNHPSSNWGEKQRAVAREFGSRIVVDRIVHTGRITGSKNDERECISHTVPGEIVDIQFPNISPSALVEEIFEIASSISEAIPDNCSGAMVMGEGTLQYVLSSILITRGIPVYVACTERKSVETVVNGITTKTNVFEFVGFRRLPTSAQMEEMAKQVQRKKISSIRRSYDGIYGDIVIRGGYIVDPGSDERLFPAPAESGIDISHYCQQRFAEGGIGD